jgi:hypothetical protein
MCVPGLLYSGYANGISDKEPEGSTIHNFEDPCPDDEPLGRGRYPCRSSDHIGYTSNRRSLLLDWQFLANYQDSWIWISFSLLIAFSDQI